MLVTFFLTSYEMFLYQSLTRKGITVILYGNIELEVYKFLDNSTMEFKMP